MRNSVNFDFFNDCLVSPCLRVFYRNQFYTNIHEYILKFLTLSLRISIKLYAFIAFDKSIYLLIFR